MKVHIVCPETYPDRILVRLVTMLAQSQGWTWGKLPDPNAELNYAFPYLAKCDGLHAAYFSHREDTVPKKADIWRARAPEAALRIVTAPMYVDELSIYGPTIRIKPPLDRDKFVPGTKPDSKHVVAGVSGFVYGGGRKGETTLTRLLQTPTGSMFAWKAAGRGWPVDTHRYDWTQMESFYQGLDVYVCTALIEGVPYPPLEALACGVPVVIPRGVGLLDELPDLPGIFRYNPGHYLDLERALTEARAVVPDLRGHDREALREATADYTARGWIRGHVEAFEQLLDTHKPTAPAPTQLAQESTKGIYVVAYGEPARKCTERLIQGVRMFMPGVPVAVASETPFAAADVSVLHPDEDLGGRTAKTLMYDLAPAHWESVLYLDADTEVVADVSFLFDALDKGWELVLTKDIDDYDEIFSLWRRDDEEHRLGLTALGSSRALQLAGGVVGFRRNARTQKFLARWYKEWKLLARRDQGALIRSLYAVPLRTLVLGNEWNSFTGLFTGETAGILHHRGGPARRLKVWKRGRLDDKDAWQKELQQHVVSEQLHTLVGPEAIEKRGRNLSSEDANVIANAMEGTKQDKEDVRLQLYAYPLRPVRLLHEGFRLGCRHCSQRINYCVCGHAAQVYGDRVQ